MCLDRATMAMLCTMVAPFRADASCSSNSWGSQCVVKRVHVFIGGSRSGGGVDFQGHRQELPERRSRSPDRSLCCGEDDADLPTDPAWDCKGASPPGCLSCSLSFHTLSCIADCAR